MQAGPTARADLLSWAGANTLEAAAKTLLSAKIIHGRWITCAESLTRLHLDAHHFQEEHTRLNEPPSFASHSIFNLPDLPMSITIHRFVVTDRLATSTCSQLLIEAHSQRTLNSGTQGLSSVGGWRGHEQLFLRSASDADSSVNPWYARTGVLDYVSEAMACLGCEGARHIGGWLNANGPRAYNALHDHGTTVQWTLILFVEPGANPSAAATDAAQDLAGALLLRTSSDSHDGHWLAIPPTPGELWALPGHVEHCVMPRDVGVSSKEEVTAGPAGASSMRVSVAVNVYRPGCAPRCGQPAAGVSDDMN